MYDNTSLDYALKIDGKARLFIEAKGIGKNLDDKQFIAQTVNYANNEGVLWCVLTNGLVYRVYKTNEPVPMEQKLLFEIELGGESAAADTAKSLELIARNSMLNEALEQWGERVFTDGRVRKAIAQLAAKPSDQFLAELNQLLGKPEISATKLRESLARVMDAKSLEAPKSSAVAAPVRKPKPPTGSPPAGGKEYSLDDHLASSRRSRQLRTARPVRSREQGADVTRRIRKQYVGYFAGKRAFSLSRSSLSDSCYLNLDPELCNPGRDQSRRDQHRPLRNGQHRVLRSQEQKISTKPAH